MAAQAILQRFQQVEADFLSAFSTGDAAIAHFVDLWSTLFHDFSAAVAHRQIDSSTISLAYATASRIAILADTFSHLHIEGDKGRRAFYDDVHKIMLQSGEFEVKSDVPGCPDSGSQSLEAICKNWLLQNLHDPYPSSTIKSMIAESCHVPAKDIQDWFADARRRTGWTTLSQERFNGSRRAISEAASCVYSEDALDNSLPLDIRRAFAAIKANAYSLFSPTPTTGALLQSQRSPVQTSDSRPSPDVSKKSDEDSPAFLSHSFHHDHHHSSPPGSSLTMSSPSFSVDEEEDTTPPPPIAGCKRRLEMSVEVEEGNESAPPYIVRPSKRCRSSSLTTDINAIALPILPQPDMTSVSLFTPAHLATRSSTEATLTSPMIATTSVPEATECLSCPTNPALAPVSASPRKRRFSDTFAGNSPKRPRGLTPAPRRQAVSDPLHISLSSAGSEIYDLEGWLQSSFDIPYAAELGHPDHPLPCDVELSTFATQSSGSTFSSSFPGLTSEWHISDADLASATPEGFDFSSYDSDAMFSSSFGLEDGSVATSDGSLASSPSSAGSYPELSDYGLTDNPSIEDWSDFLDILGTLGTSPTSSQSSLSDLSPLYPPTSDPMSSPSRDDIPHARFGADPSFTKSDLLPDIGGFSPLHIPLEAIF